MERKKILAILLALALAAAALALFAACGQTAQQEPEEQGGETLMTNPQALVTGKDGQKYPVVTMTIGPVGTFKGGIITAELYPDIAPNTVNNFISLVKEGYFVGKTFHRAVETFMIQGGSPGGDGMSVGFPYAIAGEFSGNGFENNLRHTPGVLSMARTNMPDSAGCQFFIMHGDAPHLDGQYASFGKVFKGMDVVDRIAKMPTIEATEALIDKPVITEIHVDTFGVDYKPPVTIPAQ